MTKSYEEYRKSARERIIVALDYSDLNKALDLVKKLRGEVWGFKVGIELIYSAGLPQVMEALNKLGVNVFVDIKAHDIPNTVAGAVAAAARSGADIINVHALGGAKMMQEAVKSARRINPVAKIVAVTVLTSHSDADLSTIGLRASAYSNVRRLTQLAKDSQLNGVVCSPEELSLVRNIFLKDGVQNSLIITPGIRPDWSATNDQKRFTTPATAIKFGADKMVIGRPITQHANPGEAVELIVDEIADALMDVEKTGVLQQDNDVDRLIDKLFQYEIVKFGSFILKNGSKSPIYFDVRNVINCPADLLELVIDLYDNLLINKNDIRFNHLAGVPFGALYLAGNIQRDLNSKNSKIITVRPTTKDHGTGGNLIGDFSMVDTVVIIEDVATSGGSILEIAQKLRKEGLQVTDAIVLIDRQQGAKQRLAEKGIRLSAIVTFEEIMQRLTESGAINDRQKKQVEAFLKGVDWQEIQ
ncbi:MAG: orotidine-5'-phosphate decarboxylase [Deltaproteobacteria bacterium]|jgi:orotidine-5'-phosphate decarboxylase|nr:orotidine-5'-phosphate decarboxylase [Deltaproteobacteria bacterium]